jgi:hypothetical protein
MAHLQIKNTTNEVRDFFNRPLVYNGLYLRLILRKLKQEIFGSYSVNMTEARLFQPQKKNSNLGTNPTMLSFFTLWAKSKLWQMKNYKLVNIF